MRALYKRLGIDAGITTAYHPQSNGQTERTNAEVGQYLRMFVDKRQENWADLLPTAEFALNSRVHSATGSSPFELMYGYNPDFTVPAGKKSNMPKLEERLDQLREARKDAEAALRMSKKRISEQVEASRRKPVQFQKGDKVWLDTKNLRIKQPSPKLGPKRIGPFEVLERVGDLDYKLKLP